MEDRLRKKHYSYKIQKLLMKSSACLTVCSPFLPENHDPHFCFFKSQPPITKGGRD